MFLRIPVNYIRFVSRATSSIEIQAPLYQFSTFGFLRIVVIACFRPRDTYYSNNWSSLQINILMSFNFHFPACIHNEGSLYKKNTRGILQRFDDLHKLPVRDFQRPVTSRILTPCQYRHEREVYAV